MASFAGATLAVLNRAMERPAQLAGASLQLGANLARIGPFAVARAAGAAPPPLPTGRDKRFADPAWDGQPGVRRAAPGLPGGPAVLRGPARGGPG